MTKTLLMSATDFEKQQGKLAKLSLEVHALARLILVEGKTATVAAQEVGMSKQLATHYMKRVKALLEGYPASWVQFDEWMPDWLAIETRARLKEETDKLKKKIKVK